MKYFGNRLNVPIIPPRSTMNPLDLVEGDLVLAPVAEQGRLDGGMAGDMRGDPGGATIAQELVIAVPRKEWLQSSGPKPASWALPWLSVFYRYE